MGSLLLHEYHQALGARFMDLNGQEAVAEYGEPLAEYMALSESAGIMDVSYRSRLCLLGADRVKFLNGQVTNNVKELRSGEGCYAALVSAKGKIQSDLHIYILENEILLEFEPGLAAFAQERLEKYIIAEDAQVADVSAHYGLWSIQGPQATEVIKKLRLNPILPVKNNGSVKTEDVAMGEIYAVNRRRTIGGGYDLFVPHAAMLEFANRLAATGARFCGWNALERARIEAGIPRFGMDMDETNLAPEALDAEAISYSKGCYIGQEVIARVRTYGQVAKALRGFRLPDSLRAWPAKGDRLFLGDKEVGHVTSAAVSSHFKANLALGYVRREANQIGAELLMLIGSEKVPVKIVALPFVKL